MFPPRCRSVSWVRLDVYQADASCLPYGPYIITTLSMSYLQNLLGVSWLFEPLPQGCIEGVEYIITR